MLAIWLTGDKMVSIFRHGINNDDKLVIYDNSDVVSSCRCWFNFIYFGHDPNLVHVLNGGLKKWITENKKVTTELPNIEISDSVPISLLSKISLGPVGQFVDIMNFFNTAASNNTLGNPSNFEVNMNKSDIIKYLKGLF